MLRKIEKVLKGYYDVLACEAVVYSNGFTLRDCLKVSNGLTWCIITYDSDSNHIAIWDTDGLIDGLILGNTTQVSMIFELGTKMCNYFSK